MSIPLLDTNTTIICRVVKGLYDAAPGYTYLQNFLSYTNTNGVNATVNALTNNFSSYSNAQLASLVATNVGLTGSALTAGTDYLTGQFNATTAANRGVVIKDALAALSNLSGNATYGAAADAFNASIARSESYSTSSANTSTVMSVLQGADEVSTSATTVLVTTANDVLSGTTGSDIFNAQTLGNLQSTDIIDGLAGVDTLNARVNSAMATAVSISNVEILNFRIDSMGAGETYTLDLSEANGYTHVQLAGAVSAVGVGSIDTGVVLEFGTGFGATAVTFALASETSLGGSLNAGDTLSIQFDGASAFEVQEAGGGIENINLIAEQGYTNVTAGAFTFGSALQTLDLSGTALGIGVRVHSAASSLVINATNQASVKLVLAYASGASTSALLSVTMGSASDLLILQSTGGLIGNSGLVLVGGDGTDTLKYCAITGTTLTVGSRITGFEVLELDVGSAAVNVGTAFNLGTIRITGTAAQSATVTLANNSVEVGSGYGGELTLVNADSATTADSMSVVISNASAFDLYQSAQGFESYTLTFNTFTTAIGSAANVWSAGTAGVFSLGSASVTINGTAGSIAAHIYKSGASVSGISLISASAYAGNLTLTIRDEDSEDIRIYAGAGNDTISFAQMESAGANVSALVDGGLGVDTVRVGVHSSTQLITTLTMTGVEVLRLDMRNTGTTGLINLSSKTELTALDIFLFSAAVNTANYQVKASTSLSDVDIFIGTGVTAALNALQFDYATGAVANIDFGMADSADATGVLDGLFVNSATTVNISTLGSGATGGGFMISAVAISGAQSITFNVYQSLRISQSFSAGTANTITFNVTASLSGLEVFTAQLREADLVTINAANSGGSVQFSSLWVGNGSANSFGDLVINLGSAASANIESAYVSDDVTITTQGGTAGATLLIGSLAIGSGITADYTGGASVVSVNAAGSADTVTITNLGLHAPSSDSIEITLQGAGDIRISAVSASQLWGATSLAINASAMIGTLTLNASAWSAVLVLNLGTDIASANSAAGGEAADKLYGGENGDDLMGNGGADTIYGYGGSDRFFADSGSDVFYGGAGSDVFALIGSTALVNAGGAFQDVAGEGLFDTIMDFGSGDIVYFSGINAIATWTASRSANGIAFYTATFAGLTVSGMTADTHLLAIYQGGGDTYIEILHASAVSGTWGVGSAVNRVVLNGVAGWTALTGLVSISLETSGLVITSL